MEKRTTDETEKDQINIERWFYLKEKLENHAGGRIHFSSIQIPYSSNTVESFYIYANFSCFYLLSDFTYLAVNRL